MLDVGCWILYDSAVCCGNAECWMLNVGFCTNTQLK